MFIIPNEQMQQLDRLFNDFYESQTLAFLSGKYPDWALATGAEAPAFITAGVRHAARYNLTECSEVTAFLEYSVRYGLRFEQRAEHEWAANILNVRNIHGAEKIKCMQALRPL